MDLSSSDEEFEITPEVEEAPMELKDEGEEDIERIDLGAFPHDLDLPAQVKWFSLWLAKNKLYKTLDTLLDEYPEKLERQMIEEVSPITFYSSLTPS